MSTKIFCDIADINQIKKFSKKKIVKGFTTNPSLMRSAGAKDYQKYSKEILKVCKKPISFEVFGDDYDSMKSQALIINSWGKNVYVKIPVINSKGIFMGKIIKELNKKNIPVVKIERVLYCIQTVIFCDLIRNHSVEVWATVKHFVERRFGFPRILMRQLKHD